MNKKLNFNGKKLILLGIIISKKLNNINKEVMEMPNSGLIGPYPLTHEKIYEVITRTLPGAYILGWISNGTFYVQYVGRSNSDINNRLHFHVGKYESFMFDYFLSPKSAFEKECELWHNFGGPEGRLDNKNHPDRPDGTNWRCPRCNIFG